MTLNNLPGKLPAKKKELNNSLRKLQVRAGVGMIRGQRRYLESFLFEKLCVVRLCRVLKRFCAGGLVGGGFFWQGEKSG